MTEARAALILTRLARRPALSLFVLCVVIWLPGLLVLPPLDRDESRFAQASKQMLETGDFVDIRLGPATRYNKPAGIYWLQAAATTIAGGGARDRIWTYRIPSWIGGYLALLLTYGCARAFASREAALAAATLLGISIAMVAETQIATTDAVLLATILGAQAVLFRLFLSVRADQELPARWTITAAWLAFACGILVKGPVIAGVLGATVIAVSVWERDWRWLKATRPLLGLLIIALVVLPWAVAIALHSHGAFYRQSLGHDFGDKLVGGQESHGAPPGYYLVLAALTFWPAILFVLPGIRAGWAERGLPAMRYLIAWAGSSWLLFELVPTKLPHYILPAYPPLAMLAACWVIGSRQARAPDRPGAAWRLVAALQFCVGLAASIAVVAFAPMRFGAGTSWFVPAIAAVGALAGIAALIAYVRGRLAQSLLASCLAAAIVVPTLTVGVAPGLTSLWISSRAAQLVARDLRRGDPPVVVAGYAEPSLIFLLGTQTRIAVGAGAARIAAREGGLALIEDRERNAFLAELGTRDTQAFPVDSLAGFDYSRGRKDHITVYRVVRAESRAGPQ